MRAMKNDAPHHADAIATACRLIVTAEEEPSLEALARSAHLSRFHFHRVFKQLTGVTPKAYAKAHRAGKVRRALRTAPTVTEAVYAAGYNSGGRFYAESSGALGMKPKAFRAGGSGETIRFAIGRTSLGAILVAATDQGVCAIFLGDDPDALARDLQDRFRHAEIIGADAEFETTVARVVGFVESPATGLSLPLDIRGTAFQRRVWEALRRIPPGQTMTYAQVAEAVGSPKAVRAVGAACGANPVSVAIPCHRVVRSDGALHGYRWGVPRKAELLRRERGD